MIFKNKVNKMNKVNKINKMNKINKINKVNKKWSKKWSKKKIFKSKKYNLINHNNLTVHLMMILWR